MPLFNTVTAKQRKSEEAPAATLDLFLHTLDNPNAFTVPGDDDFGRAVACSKTHLIVGAPSEGDVWVRAGKVYIFDAVTGKLLHTLDNPNPYGTTEDDKFGSAVDCSETYSIVGAEAEEGADGDFSGFAYIYNNATGALLWTLENPNPYQASSYDYFGGTVACSESYSIVGAVFEGSSGGLYSGRAYIYDNATGALLWTLDDPNDYGSEFVDQFGWDVSCSETHSLVGAKGESDVGGALLGIVYLFDNATGVLLQTFRNPNPDPSISYYSGYTGYHDEFGTSVSCSETYSALGASGEGGTGLAAIGKAYIFDNATGALLWTLSAPNVIAGRYFGHNIACSELYTAVTEISPDAGLVHIFENATGELLRTLDNPNAYGTPITDYFANAIGVTDTHLIAGVGREDEAGHENSGKAYLCKFKQETDHHLTHVLDNPNDYGTSVSDRFGSSVSCSETYSIVGAYQEDGPGGQGDRSRGRAYIYNNTTGELLWTLDDPNAYGTGAVDYFGLSVGCSETYSIVGAYGEDDAGGLGSGKAYIFDNLTGALLWTLDNPNDFSTSVGDNFGYAVSCSETYSIVGAYAEDDAAGTGSGKAYIFDNATGALLWTLDNPNFFGTSFNDSFGFSVSCSETYSIVGANGEDDADGVYLGIAYIYNNATGALLWTLENPNLNPDVTPYFGGDQHQDLFGYSVSCSEAYSAVGAHGERNEAGLKTGIVYIFDNTTGALLWTLEDPANASGTFFGIQVSCSEQYTLVGAYVEDEGSGKAYLYSNSTGVLLKTITNPNAYSTPDSDYFGRAVSASDSHIIIAASYENDAGGIESGKAYIYSNTNLVKVIDNPNPFGTSANDYFGETAACSDTYSIVGSRREGDSEGNYSGKAYIYKNTTGELLWTLDNPNPYGTSESDYFSHSLGCSETYSIVGAYTEDDAGGLTSGKAYIYDNATGVLLWTLDNPNDYDTSNGDSFGFSVSCSETYSTVGAYGEDSAVGASAGVVYIFDNATGALLWTLDNPNEYSTPAYDQFGLRVSCSETYSLVGAPGEDHATGGEFGVAYLFDNATGVLVHTFNNPSPNMETYDYYYGGNTTSEHLDGFGRLVACSETYSILGAPGEHDASGNESGKAYIFDNATGALLHTLTNPNVFGTSEGDGFGGAVACCEAYSVVGARSEDSVHANPSGNLQAGIVYIFDNVTGNLLQTITNPSAYGSPEQDAFGQIVDCSEMHFIVGVQAEDEAGMFNAGKAYLYNMFKEVT